MECPSPGVNDEFKKTFQYDRKRRSLPGKSVDRPPKLILKIGFLMDFVLSVRDLEKHYKSLRSQLIYVDDPNFFEFPNDVKLYKGDTLVIEVCVMVF